MQKKFLSSLGLILLLNLLVKPFFILGIDAEVQNRVGQEAYGTYFALLNLSFIFNILIDFGINNFNNRNISQNTQLIRKHFSKLFSVKGLLAFFYALFTLGLGLILGYKDGDFWILGVLVFNQVLVSFILFARSNLAGLQMFKSDSVVSILDRGLLIIFCGLLLFTNLSDGVFHIEWFVYLQTMAYAITLIISLIMLAGHTGRLRWNLDKAFSIQIFKKSVPYALFILTGSMYTRVDGIMLENILPNGSLHAGYYAQGYRFYEAAGMFAFLFAVLLLPIFSRMLKLGEDVKPMLNTAIRLLLGIGLFTAITFYFNGEWVLHWRYINVTPESVHSFILLMFAFCGICLFYVFGTLMTANENLKALNIIAFSGLVLNLVFNFILIPKYQAAGAAFTTMATQIFAGTMQLLFVVKMFKIKANWPMIFSFSIFTVSFVLVSYLISDQLDNGFYVFCLSVLSGLLLLVLSGTVQVRSIINFMRAEK